jgi:hypothetical protein
VLPRELQLVNHLPNLLLSRLQNLLASHQKGLPRIQHRSRVTVHPLNLQLIPLTLLHQSLLHNHQNVLL